MRLTGIVMMAALVAFGGARLEAQKAPSPLKVYCFAAPNSSGFVDQTSRSREDSVKDLKESIAKKKDWLQLVDSAAQADIVVEILERKIVGTGRFNADSTGYVDKKGTTVNSTTRTREISNYTVVARMRVGSYENDMVGEVSSEFLGGQWRAAAGQIAGEVERWAKANYARLKGDTPAVAKGASPKAAPAPPRGPLGPRQTIAQWYLAPTVGAAEAFLLKSTLAQIRAFRGLAQPNQQEMNAFVETAVAPGPSAARSGGTVAAKGQDGVVVRGDYELDITFQTEAIAGDRAFVPVSVTYAGKPARAGTFELRREDGGWRIAAVDLGDDMRFPRFDEPGFITAYADMMVKALEQERLRVRKASVESKLRQLVSAQQFFAEYHGGLFAPVECLERPSGCEPASTSVPYLSTSLDVNGYTAAFHPGRAATGAELRKVPGLRRGLKGWAFVMTPQTPSADERAYCADSNARICMLPAGAPAKLPGGSCPATCEDIKR